MPGVERQQPHDRSGSRVRGGVVRAYWNFGLLLGGIAFVAIAFSGVMRAQGVDAQMLMHPPPDSWPGYHGDYSGRRHSSLTQVTPQNVNGLTLAWAFQTSQNIPIKSSPLVVDGINYFTVPENVWAIDARSAHPVRLYHPSRPPPHHLRL